jgi:hypothetical protein
MKHSQDNTQSQAALLCDDSSVDTPVKNSLCCAAAGITALPSCTTDALTPHDKLREAATPNATLIAQDCPPAQPVVGYKHPQQPASWLDPISGRASKTYSGRYCEPLYRHPVELAQPHDAEWPKLVKPAKVGNGRFHAGVSSRLVVEAAQRQYEYDIRPPFETARNERLAESIATMVMEYVEGGLRMNLDWRPGLARIIQSRIARLLPEQPETILRLGETA